MSNFSLTIDAPVVASVSDDTVLAAGITNTSLEYAALKTSCKAYTVLGNMTQQNFNDFFGTMASCVPYIDAISDNLANTSVKSALLAAYNTDNNLTGTDKKEIIYYDTDLTNLEMLLQDSDILPSKWSDTGKFQLIFNFRIGTGTQQKQYKVGVEWGMKAVVP